MASTFAGAVAKAVSDYVTGWLTGDLYKLKRNGYAVGNEYEANFYRRKSKNFMKRAGEVFFGLTLGGFSIRFIKEQNNPY